MARGSNTEAYGLPTSRPAHTDVPRCISIARRASCNPGGVTSAAQGPYLALPMLCMRACQRGHSIAKRPQPSALAQVTWCAFLGTGTRPPPVPQSSALFGAASAISEHTFAA